MKFVLEKINSGDGHRIDFEWELITEHGTRLDLICPNRQFSYYDKPHIKFFGDQNQYVGVFSIETNKKCDELNEILRDIHYQVDPLNPIIIQFRRKDKKVKAITLPELDPYLVGNFEAKNSEKKLKL